MAVFGAPVPSALAPIGPPPARSSVAAAPGTDPAPRRRRGIARMEEAAMIIRVFQARIRPGMEAAYERLMRNAAIPLMQQQAGLLGLYVGTRLPATTPAEMVI